MKCKTRFAPSPTGRIHLGNLRTALFNLLFARAQKGTFMIRVEDTDKERSDRKYWDLLVEDLKFLDFDVDEGPLNDCGKGPYFQSERTELYQEFYDKLIADGVAYECFCTQSELALARKTQLSAGIAPRYSGECRNLSNEQLEKKRHKNPTPTLRFVVPDQELRFEDMIQGPKVFKTLDLGDFIIRKHDKTPTFMFCNAVDDALMNVTHVLRGEDHLTNTPRQILILQALGLKVPAYAHMPMIVGGDGKPLSKRNGSLSVAELIEIGYLPIAVLNLLARLGHHYAEEQLLSKEQLGELFNLEKIGRSPAFFDQNQLYHWQKEALAKLSDEEFYNWLNIEVENWQQFVKTVRNNILFPGEAGIWLEAFYGAMPYEDDAKKVLNDTPKQFFEIGGAQSSFEEAKQKLAEAGFKGKKLFMPLRAALTGRLAGPQIPDVVELLGEKEVIRRIKVAKDFGK